MALTAPPAPRLQHQPHQEQDDPDDEQHVRAEHQEADPAQDVGGAHTTAPIALVTTPVPSLSRRDADGRMPTSRAGTVTYVNINSPTRCPWTARTTAPPTAA